jgi:NADPH-dependent ferric siderophore reductase
MSDTQTPTPVSTAPKIERVRHELKRRLLTVAQVDSITPGMLRIQFGGDDLSDFVSMAPDDHIKIFVPTMDGTEERRDYTPRRYDAAARMLAIDFAVHEAGPITQWAINARPGDTLAIGGPRGSAVISDIKQWLLIGDETALPAIGRRIEAAGGEARITAVMAVANPAEHQTFKTNAELICHWAHRPLSEATDASALLSVLRSGRYCT